MAMTEERAAERNTAERSKAVDAALASIEKQFGRGAIMKLGSREKLVLDIDERDDPAAGLGLGQDVLADGRLARRLGAEDLGDPAARDAAHSES